MEAYLCSVNQTGGKKKESQLIKVSMRGILNGTRFWGKQFNQGRSTLNSQGVYMREFEKGWAALSACGAIQPFSGSWIYRPDPKIRNDNWRTKGT